MPPDPISSTMRQFPMRSIMADRPNYAARAAAGQTNATYKGPRNRIGGGVSGAQNFLLTYPLERLNTPSLLALLFPARSAPVEKSNRVRKIG
jgi:hypothetical protein